MMRIALQLLAVAIAAFSTVEACTVGVGIFYPLAAGCLTTNSDGDLLLVQDFNGQWTFPAGTRSRIFESGADIAESETFEESSVVVDPGFQVCGVRSFSFFGFDLDLFAGYCCELVDAPEVLTTTDPQIQTAAFVSRETIVNFLDSELRFPDQRQLLLGVIDGVVCA